MLDVGIGFQLGVGRDQPVVASDLDAVPGEEHDCHFDAACASAELEQRPAHFIEAEVFQPAHRKSQSSERRRDVACVVGRVAQRPDMPVGAVPDHERHAVLGPARLRRKHDEEEKRGCDSGRAPWDAKPRRATLHE